MPCRAWPNSWNSVRASSTLMRLASPSPPLAKFITLTTIGNCRPSSFCWPRKLLIHAPLLREIAPIPGRDLEIAPLAGRDRLQRLFIFPCAGDARRPDRLEQIERGLRGLRHRVCEAIVGEGLIAEQARPLGSQAHHF